MLKLNFTGKQKIQEKTVEIYGHFDILPKEREYEIPVKGMITIIEPKYLAHSFTGSIVELMPGSPPRIILYTDNGMGMKLFYKFESPKVVEEKLVCPGIWCPINKETTKEILSLIGNPKTSQKTSLEFLLRTDKDKSLLEQAGFCNFRNP